MEEALIALLLNDLYLAAFVAQRINWSVRPQWERLPAVVLEVISAPRQVTLDGPSGLVAWRVQIDCWAQTAVEVTTVKRLVIAAIHGKHQVIMSTDSPSVSLGMIQGVFLNNERRDFEDGASGAEKFHRVSLDFIIWHE